MGRHAAACTGGLAALCAAAQMQYRRAAEALLRTSALDGAPKGQGRHGGLGPESGEGAGGPALGHSARGLEQAHTGHGLQAAREGRRSSWEQRAL
jgi:hypothetical protein